MPAGVFVGNGYGKLAGVTQIEELGVLETPILLTNTLSVAPAIEALIEYTLTQDGNEQVQSVNAVVGETNDGVLNDIRGRHVRAVDGLAALAAASGDETAQGCVGAGTGTVCFGFKGGIGTASRVLSENGGGYTIGALVQTNFGGALRIDGVPVEDAIVSARAAGAGDGSCMMVIATDAPLDSRNLRRLAKRAFMGLARTGGFAANGSGDYVIAFSTADALRIPHRPADRLRQASVLHDDFVSPLFQAAVEATEEAIINSLFMAETTSGFGGSVIRALPVERILPLLKQAGRIST